MIKKYILVLIILFSIPVFSQNPAIIENTFNINNISNVSGGVLFGFEKCFPMAGGKTLVYKNCTGCRFNGEVIGKYEVLNSNGVLDPMYNSFGNNFLNTASDVYVYSDGKQLVAGNFVSYNGTAVTGLVKLNTDGTIDNSFSTSLNGGVSKILLQLDGKILITGSFTSYGGTTYNGIMRLNSDGSVDTAFSSGTGFNGAVNSMVFQNDGKVVVVGNFTTYNGSASNRIIRLNNDGSYDNSFVIGSGFNINVNSVCLSQDNKIFVGGNFTLYNGITNNKIVKLNLDGTIDSTFITGTGFSNTVTKILLMSDGNIAVFGNFSSYKSSFQSISIKLDNVGDKIATSVFSKKSIKDAFIQNDGKIIIVGDFSAIGNVVVNSIARLNSDESVDTSFAIGVGFNNIVYKAKQQADGKILVGGDFTLYNNIPLRCFARLNEDGSIDSSFNNAGTGFNNGVTKFEIQPDGKIIVVGYFTSYNGIAANRIVRLNTDGSLDSSFLTGTGFDDVVYDVVLQADGKIIVAGLLRYYNGISADLLARLNSDGSFDTDYNLSDLTNKPEVLALQSDGKLLVATLNTSTGNATIKRFNINGTSDSFFYSLTGATDGFKALAPQPDGKIIVGGGFSTTTNNLRRLNANGTNDASFITGTGFNGAVRAIFIQPDNKILVGGSFNTYNGTTSWHGIRLNANGSVDNSFYTGLGFTGSIYNFNLQSDGKILVAGAMVNYGTYTIGSLVRLIGGGFYNLSGQNKLDVNLNGCDVSDYAFPNLKMNFNDGFSSYDFYVNNTGDYSFLLSQGSYTITPYVNPNFSISPTSVSATFPSQYTSLVQNYCITPLNGTYTDLDIQIIPLNNARPGFDARYEIVFKNKWVIPQSGQVNLFFDDQVMDLVNAVPTNTSQSTNMLSWDFANLNPQESRSIFVTMNLNSPVETPALNSGSLLSFNGTFGNVLPDYAPNDNAFTLNQSVVNSYDPNEIQCLQGETVGPEKIGDYVHYLIRFENKGTANAQFIRVEDVIDTAKFDLSTLEPLKGSHSFITKISNGNKAEFYFNNINLPFDDANNDGYVMYKIKLKPTLVLGDVFTNTASIYFDFNPAIITNTATTTIASALGTIENSLDTSFSVYPNPASNSLTIDIKNDFDVREIYIYNTIGQLVLKMPYNKNDIDISKLAIGSYILKLSTSEGLLSTRFIKK